MNEHYDIELDRLHSKLRAIYSLGPLTPAEKIAADGLWARIERLEAAKVAVTVRESKGQGNG